MLIASKKSVKLKPGHTYVEYILKRNETCASYDDLCAALKLKFPEARAIYDRVSDLQLEDIGEIRQKSEDIRA